MNLIGDAWIVKQQEKRLLRSKIHCDATPLPEYKELKASALFSLL